jgi:16S rRNA (guanine966-N2)-methyltransferase
VRIIAGEWRGRRLIVPPGLATRPTSDRAREGLFSMLVSRLGTFEGLQVADLFAGSGALGLEALSRGAMHCLFVDKERTAVDAIKANVEALGAGDRTETRQQAAEYSMVPAQPCDLILLDPPYGSGLGERTLEVVAKEEWLRAGALVSVEIESEMLAIPDGLEREAYRRFGRAHVHLLRRSQ